MKGKNIAISEMSGSGGPSFYYEIDENNHIDLTYILSSVQRIGKQRRELILVILRL